jgi:hypothetical protein
MKDARDCSLPFVESWKGKWIWLKESANGLHDYVCFRKELLLNKKSNSPVIHITAEREYILWVNERFVGRGPALSDQRYKRYNSFCLKDFLVSGEKNVITVLAYHHENQGPRRLTPYEESRGILCQIDDIDKTILVSDESWKAIRHKGWLPPTIRFDDSEYPEWYNAQAFPENWRQLDFSSSTWPNAVSCMPAQEPLWGSTIPQNRFFPWVNLIPSEIKPPQLLKRFPQNATSGEVIQRREFSPQDSAIRMSLEEIIPCCKASVTGIESLYTENDVTVAQIKNSDCFESDKTFDGIHNATIIFDFGKLMNARFGFKLKSQNNVKIDIGYAWNLENGRIVPYVSSRTPQAECYFCKDGMQKWQTFGWRHFRYVQITFRDLMEELELYEVWAEEIVHQFPEAASISSDNELLNASWKATENTVRLCCTDQTMDNPSRERKQYSGDCSAIVPAIDNFFGQSMLVKKYFHQFDESQHRTGLYRYSTGHDNDRASLFDHSLAVPIRLYEHYMRSGDNELVSKMMPGIKQLMKLSESILNPNGVALLPPYGIWFDWACVKRENISFILNAMVAKAFDAAAELAKYTGIEADISACWKNKSKRIFQFLHDNFYDKQRGVYVDCLKEDGTQDPFVSEHSNSLAVLWEIADIKQTNAIMNAYADNQKLFSAASPAWKYLPEALVYANRTDLMLDWMKRKYKPVLDAGYNTFPETWCIYGENTLGHWRCRNSRAITQGAGLALPDAVVNGIAGIISLKPGFKEVMISPKPGDIKSLKITLPGPDGAYKLQYSNNAFEKVYNIKLPVSKPCKFTLTTQDFSEDIIINGVKAEPESGNKTFNNKTSLCFDNGKGCQWEIKVLKK